MGRGNILKILAVLLTTAGLVCGGYLHYRSDREEQRKLTAMADSLQAVQQRSVEQDAQIAALTELLAQKDAQIEALTATEPAIAEPEAETQLAEQRFPMTLEEFSDSLDVLLTSQLPEAGLHAAMGRGADGESVCQVMRNRNVIVSVYLQAEGVNITGSASCFDRVYAYHAADDAAELEKVAAVITMVLIPNLTLKDAQNLVARAGVIPMVQEGVRVETGRFLSRYLICSWAAA